MIAALGHDDRRRHRLLDVVLGKEHRHDLGQRSGIGVARKEAAVADVAPAADHHDVDGDHALVGRGGDDVDVSGRRALDELPRLELGEPGDLVAQLRRALERERRGGPGHLRLQRRDNLAARPCRNSTALSTSAA